MGGQGQSSGGRGRPRVEAVVRAACRVLFFFSATAAACAAAEETAAFVEGAIAPFDLIAPVDLQVLDEAAPETIGFAARGTPRPIVVRPDPEATEAAVAEFNAAFAAARVAFLDGLERSFGKRVLDAGEVEGTRLAEFRSEFQAAHPAFPVGFVLAQSWAGGGSGEELRARLAGVLRETMTRHLVVAETRRSEVLVVEAAREERFRSWSEAAPRVRAAVLGEVLDREQAARELPWALDPLERFAAGHLAGLVRPSAVFDEHLTGLLLHERFGAKLGGRFFACGEILVRGGGRIDRMAALALEQLKRAGIAPLTTVSSMNPPSAAEAGTAPAIVAPTPEAAAQTTAPRRPAAALAAGFLAAALVAVAAWLVWRRKARHRAPPAASFAEAEAAPGSLRAALLPHLARELKDRLVHALFAQRQHLLQNEAAATERVAEFEERLANLHPAIADRIEAYERRIAELERELGEREPASGDEVRAELVLAREELELTRQRAS